MGKGSGQGGRCREEQWSSCNSSSEAEGSLDGAGLVCRCREHREALAQGRGVERGALGVLVVPCCCGRRWEGGGAHRVG